MADKIVLYSYFRSSASWRVRIALAWKNVKYEYKPVHLVKDGGEQYSEEYTKLNPMSMVPTLQMDGHTFTQSLPIIEYLDEKFPDPPLLPKNSADKAKVRALAEIINSGTQPLQNLRVLKKVGEGSQEWARYFIENGLKSYEKAVQETAGVYSYGNDVTLADLCLVPQLYNAKRFSLDLSQFPTITRIVDALEKLPAFIAADFSRQPDTPEDMRSS